MAAEIRVDTITSRTGINTLSFTGSGLSYTYNVGFGTTTNPRAKVDVEGDAFFNGGKVGIGTTLPTSKLDIVGDVQIAGVITATQFKGDGSTLTGVAATSNIRTNAITNSGVTTVSLGSASIPTISPSGGSNTGIFFPSTNTTAFSQGGVEALRIASDGSVGIKTTDTSQGILTLAALNTTGPTITLKSATNSAFINNWSNPGGGSNRTNRFEINACDTGLTAAICAATNIEFHTTSTNTERLRITSSGLVGIGLTTPTSRLTVTGDVLISGVGTATEFNSTSDIALKENITVIDNPITKLSELRGVTFDWKQGGSSVGVIAQDVEKIFPQAVRGEENHKSVNYNAVIGLLVESIKEQQKEIDELKSRLDK